MSKHRVILTVIGMSVFAFYGQWPGEAAAQVNIDIGGLHVGVGNRPPPPPPQPVVMEFEVLTRGPVHEAFAQPVTFAEEAAFIIAATPPAPLDEIVPEDQPQGDQIVWIPGYWSWDTDRNVFIWVSGCWRAVPPNTSWVPGYWAQSGRGFQWTAGFWASADVDEIVYLPAPPATLEAGPQGIGNRDSIWVPGCWVYTQGRYMWRPGFWEQARTNWVWEPAHYVHTPRGYIYVEGYWDYSLDRRGVAFLPAYVPQRLYAQRGYRYSPQITLDLGALTLNLFSSPQRHHYYFGDYYGPEYSRAGFHPWYEARDQRNWYDSIFTYQQWQHRDDRRWVDTQRAEYERRRDNQSLRPARTYEAMRTQAARLPERDRRAVQVARPVSEVVAEKTTPFKFDRTDAKRREAALSRAREVQAYKDKRSQWEASRAAPQAAPAPRVIATPREAPAPRAPDRAVPRELPRQPDLTPREQPQKGDRGAAVREPPARQVAAPEKVKIPKPPIVVRQPAGKDLAAPPRPKHPDPTPDAQPQRGKDAKDAKDTKDVKDSKESKDSKDASDHSKDDDRSKKDKPDSKKK